MSAPTPLEPGQHYRLGRMGLPVTARVSGLPEASMLLQSPGGWVKYHVIAETLFLMSGQEKGRARLRRTLFTVDDLVIDDKAPAGETADSSLKAAF
jgi:hypothetical protein